MTSPSDEEARRAAVLSLVDGEADLARLTEALGDPSWRVRKEAAARAALWPEPRRAADALCEALAEPENVGRRNAAVEGLVRLGIHALPPLVDALGKRPDHRKLIVDALGLIGDRRAAAPLAASLEDPDPNVRAAAAEALGLVGGPEAEAALSKALERREMLLSLACLGGLNRMAARQPVDRLAPLTDVAVLRPAALEALGYSGDARAVIYLIAGLPANARSAREAAATALERLHHHFERVGDDAAKLEMDAALAGIPADAEKLLIEALLEGAPGARRSAATLLGWARRGSAVRALALAIGDPAVSEAAADALSTIGPSAVPVLCQLAPGLDPQLRSAIYAVLPRLGPQLDRETSDRVQALLASALTKEDAEAAAAAARALGEVGGPSVLEPLFAALLGPTRVALAAAQSLGQLGALYYEEVRKLAVTRGLGGPDAPHVCRVLGALARTEDVPLLLGALRSESPAVRRAAAEALARLGGDEVESALCFALADEVSEVRAQVARSLGLRASPHAVMPLASACADGDAGVRAAAARALGAIGGAEALEALRQLARTADGPTSIHALEALGRACSSGSHDPSDELLLVSALDREDAEVVKAAARALGLVGGPRAVAGLGRALQHARWDVRRVAAQALGESSSHGAEIPPLRLLQERLGGEPDELVREAIGEAVARIERR